MSIRRALDRTIRLIRDDISERATDGDILSALTRTEIAIVADEANLSTHSSQTALVTVALLMARSGHTIYLDCPEMTPIAPQIPLGDGPLVAGLIGANILPITQVSTRIPAHEIDLVICLGDSRTTMRAKRTIHLNASNWLGEIKPADCASPWEASAWPIGGMISATLGAVEAFKAAVSKLGAFARNKEIMQELYAPTSSCSFEAAPAATPLISKLDDFDCVSGGAIIHSTLFALSRLPNVTGNARVIEPDHGDLSNLNRYMLLSHDRIGTQKAHELARICRPTGLKIEAVPMRFIAPGQFSLEKSVLVGVDDIPTRWLVQRSRPEWLGIGATTHWSAMVSHHIAGRGGCAECLHPVDDPNDQPIPTVAFVSFFAGLLLATKFLQRAAGLENFDDQQVFTTLLRAERPYRSRVKRRNFCPTCGLRNVV